MSILFYLAARSYQKCAGKNDDKALFVKPKYVRERHRVENRLRRALDVTIA